jgi:hypothetical protein
LSVAAGAFLLMVFAGWRLIGCFRVHIPFLARAALALPLGIGVCGTLFTLFALAGLLHWWTVLPGLAGLLGALVYLSRQTWRRAKVAEGTSDVNRRIVFEMQNDEARAWFSARIERPDNPVDTLAAGLMRGLLGLIILLTFYHAVFFPEVYHDALILYLGYARWIFLEHSFPTRVVGQVGVGLGANYPHLFELTGAWIATLARRWSPLYLQFAVPLCGLASILLIYHVALRMLRSVLSALAVTLFVQAMPYLITYHTWTSNYSFVILFSAAFFYLALRYMEDGLPGYYVLATLTVAFAMHINYLMGSLWLCWAAMLLLTHWPARGDQPILARMERYSPSASAGIPPACARVAEWRSFRQVVREPLYFGTFLASVALGSIWYVRNWIVTGNPVYAFFTGIFGGNNINPEVMASASLEWQAHGDGIGIADGFGLAPWLGLPESPLLERLLYTWPFFANQFNSCYKWAPAFLGLVVPGVLVFLLGFVVLVRQGKYHTRGLTPPLRRFGLVALLYLVVLFGYHYLLGPYYLYHLLGACAVFGVFIAFVMRLCPGDWRYLFIGLALFAGLMPGLPWALMGSKIGSPDLRPLRNPGASERLFYQWKFGRRLPLLWEETNRVAKGRRILTHENRMALFDPSIDLVQMDGLEAQEMWGLGMEKRLERLREWGVDFYLRVPFEMDHPINARVNVQEWIDGGELEMVFDAGDSALYRFPWAPRP